MANNNNHSTGDPASLNGAKAGTMMTEQEYQDLLDRIAGLRSTVAQRISGDLIQNPPVADEL